MPTRAEFVLGLSHVEREYPSIHLLRDGRVTAEEWALIEQSPKSIAFFHEVALFTGEHWVIPFTAVGLYIVLITVGPVIMARRSGARSRRAPAARRVRLAHAVRARARLFACARCAGSRCQ
jgi:hypothetical protein